VSDPRARLYRRLPAEAVALVPPLADKLFLRDVEPASGLKLAEHRAPVSFTVRAPSRKQEVGPYCPQLIRLVRHPYRQETVRPVRKEAAGRARPSAREPVVFGAELREVIAAERRLPFPRATDCHPPVAREPLPTVDEWLAARRRGGRA